jgi:phage baseplate assembly protein W
MSRPTRHFTDLDAAFSFNPRTRDVAVKNDDNAVRGALRNLINTKHFERPFHPEIGCQIHNLLFENMHPLTLHVAERAIRDTINKFEPRVELLDVNLKANDDNELNVEIIYKIKNTDQPSVFTTTFTRVR